MPAVAHMFDRFLFNINANSFDSTNEIALRRCPVTDFVSAVLYEDDPYYVAVYYDRKGIPFMAEASIHDAEAWESGFKKEDAVAFVNYLSVLEEKFNSKA